jgi:hypothetical protein
MDLRVCHRPDCNPVLETEPPILVRCKGCGNAGGGVGITDIQAIEKWNAMIDRHNDFYFAEEFVRESTDSDGFPKKSLSVSSQRWLRIAQRLLGLNEEHRQMSEEKKKRAKAAWQKWYESPKGLAYAQKRKEREALK